MLKIQWKLLILISILLLAFILRFYNLGTNPPGIHADEADTAYSAYSILKTGKTQYGTFNLLALSEFNGGTHPPIYTYILLPLIAFFGLTIEVERFPSVLFGTFSILLVYLLVLKMLNSRKTALVAATFIAINPWAIHMSRQGLLEAIALFFVLLGMVFFLYADGKTKYYILSAIAFGFSLHSYDAPKVVTPLLILALIIINWKIITKRWRNLVYFVAINVIFMTLMVVALMSQGQIRDYSQVSLFDTQAIEKSVHRERTLTTAPLWLSSVFHNKVTVSFSEFLTSYSRIFTFNWMFINGSGNLQQAVGRHGQFHLFELPLFFIGIYYLLLRKKRRVAFFLIFWMIIAPLSAAITKSGNFPYRAILLLPVPLILSSVGLVFVWENLKKLGKLKFPLHITIIGVISVFTVSFLYNYFFDYPVYASERWAKQQNEILRFVSEHSGKVYVDGGLDWPVMFAFMHKVDPATFQDAYLNQKSFAGNPSIELGNITFGIFNFETNATPSALFDEGSLVVTTGLKFKDIESEKVYYNAEKDHIIFRIIRVNNAGDSQE